MTMVDSAIIGIVYEGVRELYSKISIDDFKLPLTDEIKHHTPKHCWAALHFPKESDDNRLILWFIDCPRPDDGRASVGNGYMGSCSWAIPPLSTYNLPKSRCGLGLLRYSTIWHKRASGHLPRIRELLRMGDTRAALTEKWMTGIIHPRENLIPVIMGHADHERPVCINGNV